MEMNDNVIYSVPELPSEAQALSGHTTQQNASSAKPSLSFLVAIALGFLDAVLASLLLYQWIWGQGSNRALQLSCSGCPDYWMRYGNHCYYFSEKKKDWNSSMRFCLAKGSHLVVLADNQETHQLTGFLSEDFHWVGLRKDHGWRWEDGSVLNSSRIHSNSLVQTCGSVNIHGFQASSCEVPLRWICKISL